MQTSHRVVLSVTGLSVFVLAVHAAAAPTAPAPTPTLQTPVAKLTIAPKLLPLDSPTLRFQELKATPTFLAPDKLRILRISGTTEERDLDAPMTLSPRAPYHSSGASLAFFESTMVRADTDVAYTPMKSGGGTFVALNFTAQPERRYLVDCKVVVGPGDMMQMTAMNAPSGFGFGMPTVYADAKTTVTSNHASLVIPKAAAARNVMLTMRVDGDGTKNWGLWSCEITPVRG